MRFPKNEFWDLFRNTDGALSCAEAIAILNIAGEAPYYGMWIEFGVFRGKSCIAAAASQLLQRKFFLVEPEFNDEKFAEEVYHTVSKLCTPEMIGDYSTNIIEKYKDYGYVFIDSGSHQDGLPMQEVKMLEDRMVKGGIIAFHDFGNQFREPKEAAEYLVSTGKYEWIDIDWPPIFDYVKANDLEDGNISWHQYPDLPHPPNFVGAVRRK